MNHLLRPRAGTRERPEGHDVTSRIAQHIGISELFLGDGDGRRAVFREPAPAKDYITSPRPYRGDPNYLLGWKLIIIQLGCPSCLSVNIRSRFPALRHVGTVDRGPNSLHCEAHSPKAAVVHSIVHYGN